MITAIESMQDLQRLVAEGERDWAKYGDVRAVYDDGLVLFNYTPAAQIAGRWNWFETNSRGLILDATTGAVVALPFPKFFNWGERGEVDTTTAPIVAIDEKLDGSLGILYRHRGQWRIATRGAFNSAQAVWATRYLNDHHRISSTLAGITLLFEIIYPDNRVVVDYGEREGLVLIGARDTFRGNDLTPKALCAIATAFNFPLPTPYVGDDVDSVIARAKALPANEEGYVVRFADGKRFKMKGDEYRRMHRFVTGLSFNRVLEAVRDNRFAALIEGIPDEFLVHARGWRTEISVAVAGVKINCEIALRALPPEASYARYATATDETEQRQVKKAFALWVNENHKGDMKDYLFKYWAGQDVSDLVYRRAFVNRTSSISPAYESVMERGDE